MNLFAIAGSFRRHKWATIPVIVLTAIAVMYIIALKPPTYAAKAYVLLENPPNVGQIHVDPKLPPINSNNPLASLENLAQVADVLSEVVTSPAETQQLEQEGASQGYQLTPDSSLGTPPAIDITGAGSSPQAAIQSAQLVANAVMQELNQLQVAQHVNKMYMITSIEYVKPTKATASSKSKIRSAVIVLAIGLIVLLVTVSVSQSAQQRRRDANLLQEGRPSPGKRASSARTQYFPPNDLDRSDSASSIGYSQRHRPQMPADTPQEFDPGYLPDVQKLQSDRRWQ